MTNSSVNHAHSTGPAAPLNGEVRSGVAYRALAKKAEPDVVEVATVVVMAATAVK